MKSAFRFLLGIVALCTMTVSVSARECCDIAHELNGKQNLFDYLDDQYDSLDDDMQLGLQLQQQILMRVPFTDDDMQAWMDISGVILNIDDEMKAIQAEQDTLAWEIVLLNQELFMCSFVPDNPPALPMPTPEFFPAM